jgi:transposase
VLRTNVPAEAINTANAESDYKSLAQVERAFRGIKAIDLEIRPIYHCTSPRVRAHVLLCTLSYRS